MCVLGMALQTEETKSTPENSRLWMYSRCQISSFTQFPNLVFFPITQKVAVLKSCKYTLVTAKLYFLNCSLSRGVVHWEMSEGFTTTASIRQQYWSRVFREIRNRTQTFGVRYLSTQKIELRPSLQAQSQFSFLGCSLLVLYQCPFMIPLFLYQIFFLDYMCLESEEGHKIVAENSLRSYGRQV